MFGNNRRPAFGFLETLGFLTVDPRAAWEEMAQPSRLASGALVAVLAVFGKVLTGPLPWDAGPRVLLTGFLKAGFDGLLLWVLPAVILHVLSHVFRRRGSLSSFLAVTGWAGVVLWAALPLRLIGDSWPLMRLLTGLPRLGLTLLYYSLWWGALRRVYGWTKGGAFLLLAGLLLAGALAAGAAGLATTVLSLGNGALLKNFLP